MIDRYDGASASDFGQWVRTAINTHEAKLICYAARLLGDLDLARDAVQDTFLKLCRQERSKIDGHLAPWLYTVCRNRCFELMRKDKRMTTLEEVHLDTTEADVPDPSSRLQTEDDRSQLMKAIATLPERQQEVLRLKFQDGLSYKEISRVTQLTVTNVGVILHNAVKRIRKEVGRNTGITLPQEGR